MKWIMKHQGIIALVFVISLFCAVAIPLFLPPMLSGPRPGTYNPEWVPLLGLAFGAVAVITTPIAWRWLYRRPRA